MFVGWRIFTNDASGVLTTATTHTQARYTSDGYQSISWIFFLRTYVSELIQGTPQEIEALLHNGGADIGIASER